jgi:hypothetical protein
VRVTYCACLRNCAKGTTFPVFYPDRLGEFSPNLRIPPFIPVLIIPPPASSPRRPSFPPKPRSVDKTLHVSICYKTKPEELSVPYHYCMLTSAAAIVAELASDRKMWWPYSGSHVRTLRNKKGGQSQNGKNEKRN